MSQITSGIRAVLSRPSVYSAFQYLLGAHAFWLKFVNITLKAKPTDVILDIGCGPADVLAYLPQSTQYWGYDISDEYIKNAQAKYGTRGHFVSKLLDEEDLRNLPKFDIVLLIGVLHHLDDDVAKQVVHLSHMALKDGGKLICIDPCFAPDQNPIARFLISKDRGQNVRVEASYAQLVERTFAITDIQVIHKAWIPYTHCYMICTK